MAVKMMGSIIDFDSNTQVSEDLNNDDEKASELEKVTSFLTGKYITSNHMLFLPPRSRTSLPCYGHTLNTVQYLV